MQQNNLIDTALGLTPPDLYLQGGTVVNVYSGEIYEADIAVKDGRIAYVGKGLDSALLKSCTKIDLRGFTLLPGFIEPHGHPSQLHTTVEYSRAVAQSGITAVVADSYRLLKALDLKRFVHYLGELEKATPVKIYWFIRIFGEIFPSSTETTEKKEAPETFLSLDELRELLNQPRVLGIGETTRWTDILEKKSFPLEAISMVKAAGKRPDGHTAGASGKNLAALAAAGISGCHESVTAEEALERLRNGMHVMLRHSSQRPDLHNFLEILREKKIDLSRVMLTSDGTSPASLGQGWNIATMAEKLIKEGVDPTTAVRLITLNPASYYRIDHEIGSLAPGRAADIVAIEGFNLSRPSLVIIDGRVVYDKNAPEAKNKACFKSSPLEGLSKTYFASNWQVTAEIFAVPAPAKPAVKFPVIEIVNSVITRRLDLLLPVAGNTVTLHGSATADLLKIALLDMRKRCASTGFIKGLAQGIEGFASSVCCALGVIIVFGNNDAAMALAANRVLEMGGGIAIAEKGHIQWEMKLELPGELTNLPLEEVLRRAKELEAFACRKGYRWGDFYHTVLFLPGDFLPYLRLSTAGIFDVLKKEVVYHGIVR